MNLFDLEALREHVREEAAARLLAREFGHFVVPAGPLFFTTPMGLPALWWDQDVKLTLERAFPLPPEAESRHSRGLP